MIQVIDAHNLYHSTRAKHNYEARVDYEALFKDRSIVVGFNSEKFEGFMRLVGYEVYFTDAAQDSTVLLIAQLLRIDDDHIIICSNDPRLVHIIEVLKGKGKYVEIIGAGIGRDLRLACNKWTEIGTDLLCTNA